jgi:hypothetical protein
MVSTFFYKNKLRDPFILHHWSKLKKNELTLTTEVTQPSLIKKERIMDFVTYNK